MAQWEKTLERMRESPQGDWSIDDLERIAARAGITCRKPGSSHATFSHPAIEEILTVPMHRPIKAFYVRRFVDLVDEALKMK